MIRRFFSWLFGASVKYVNCNFTVINDDVIELTEDQEQRIAIIVGGESKKDDDVKNADEFDLKFPWKIFNATPIERDTIFSVSRENPSAYEVIVEKEWMEGDAMISKIIVRAASVELLKHLWYEVRQNYWVSRKLNCLANYPVSD